jgi:hypothetical protein
LHATLIAKHYNRFNCISLEELLEEYVLSCKAEASPKRKAPQERNNVKDAPLKSQHAVAMFSQMETRRLPLIAGSQLGLIIFLLLGRKLSCARPDKILSFLRDGASAVYNSKWRRAAWMKNRYLIVFIRLQYIESWSVCVFPQGAWVCMCAIIEQ